MNRVLGWLRSLRLWFANQQALTARTFELERQLADARRALADLEAAGRNELSIVIALHDLAMAEQRATVAELRRENADWQALCEDVESQKKYERALSNAAWQRLARVGTLADRADTPPHLAALIRTHTARTESIEVVANAS